MPRSQRKAYQWYRKAAERGDPDAQRIVGYCLHEGIGTMADATEAIRWYRRAARQGDAVAMHNLGLSYLYGDGVRKSERLAKSYLTAAAQQGYRRSSRIVDRLK